MKEILPEIDRWKEDGEKVVVATGGRDPPLGAAPDRGEPRDLRVREDVRLRLRRLRRERRLRERAGGARDRRAEAPLVRHRRRPRVERRPAVRRRDRRLPRAGRVGEPDPSARGAPRVRGARDPLHRDRGRRGGDEGARARVGRADRRGARRGRRAVRRADPARPESPARARRRLEGLRRVVRPAAAPLRLRRRRHGRGAVPRREAPRLDAIVADARGEVRDARAHPVGRRAHRRVAGRGARAGAARPPDRHRRPHARRQVRRAGAHRRARDRGVLHRRARLAPQPGAPPRAAARGRRRGVGARADHGPVRPRHRCRHAGGDRALDPRGDPRRARAARGRLPEDAKKRIHVEVE